MFCAGMYAGANVAFLRKTSLKQKTSRKESKVVKTATKLNKNSGLTRVAC